jgi:adenosylmethionine-8-amino-7-oxononanoate aminotransferase
LTTGALALGGSGVIRHEDVPNFVQLEAQDCFNCPFDLAYPSCQLHCASALERLIEREGPDTIAAFVGVPSTNGGPVPDEYWPRIREICSKYQILLVSDEVLEGMWRIGPALALSRWGVVPDIVATGKALGAGYIPIFATLVTAEVRDTLAMSGRFWGGHTYSGHALSCDVALAVLDEIEARVVSASAIDVIESRLREVLATLCRRIPGAKLAVIGAMGRLIVPCAAGVGTEFYLEVQRLLRSCGLLLWIEDIREDLIELGIGPPYTADREFFDELERRLEEFLAKLGRIAHPASELRKTV